jgi:hypothetical protein
MLCSYPPRGDAKAGVKHVLAGAEGADFQGGESGRTILFCVVGASGVTSLINGTLSQEQKEVFGDATSAQRTVSEGIRSWDAAGGAAMLKVRCETSRSSYAMFWERYKCIVSCIFQSATAISQNYSTVHSLQ